MYRGLLIVSICLGSSLAAAQTDLVNDSLSGAPPGAWTFVQVSGSGDTARQDTDRGGDGDWAMGGSDGSGSSAAREFYYHQTFSAASLPAGAGSYTVDVSGWCKAWAGWWGGENWNWLQQSYIELWIDGVEVWQGDAGQCSSVSPWDTWEQQTHSADYTINTSIQIRMHGIKNNDNCGSTGLGAIYWDCRFDDIVLTLTSLSVTDWHLY